MLALRLESGERRAQGSGLGLVKGRNQNRNVEHAVYMEMFHEESLIMGQAFGLVCKMPMRMLMSLIRRPMFKFWLRLLMPASC